jgi:hypothetical protein
MNLKLINIGQIHEADVSFGDLTVLVGPQATGKSITLQFLKLVLDMDYVRNVMAKHGLSSSDFSEFLDIYFGEGMRAIWREGESLVWWRGKPVDLPSLVMGKPRGKPQSLYYIPAQRVLTLRDGWPRPFTDYAPGDPFAVREFSERLRMIVEQNFLVNANVFPQERRFRSELRLMLERTVFTNFELRVDKRWAQKRLVLRAGSQSLPFMVWSAGQREFVPLLLGLYELMPLAGFDRRGQIKWLVLEEPEMGLHPRAITALFLIVLELLRRGYRVCLSTHAPQVLEAVWALRHLKANKASPRAVLQVFDAVDSEAMRNLAKMALAKNLKVYYFDPATGRTRNISDLDPSSEEAGEAGWGGLTEFSGRANSAVARAVANAGLGVGS